MQNTTPDDQDHNFLPVIVTLVDGENLKGAISISRKNNLGEILNGPDLFILFKVDGGDLIYLAQKTIAAVQSAIIPEAQQAEQSTPDLDVSSPYEILKIAPDANKNTIRQAYHALIRQYHPDQFANAALPREVLEYFEAVIHRINAAYNDVLDEMDRAEKREQVKAPRQNRQKTGTHGIQ